MGLVRLNLKPEDKQVRQFGVIALFMCSLVGLALMLIADLPVMGMVCFCLAGIGIFLLSRISIKSARIIYIGLMVITFPIGWVVSHALMAIFYYVVISGVGLVFRLRKRDKLNLKFDCDAETYWQPYEHNRKAKDYFHQF